MIISRELKFVFVHNPRTGGKRLTRYLMPYASTKITNLKEDAHGIVSYHVDGLHAGYKHNHPDYLSFGFVRNPYTWTESVYYATKVRRPKGFKVSLEDWLVEIAANRVQPLYSINQIDRLTCKESGQKVKIIGKFENRVEDINKIMDILKIPHMPDDKRGQERRGKPRATHTEKSIKLVQQLYAKDFEILGYEKHLEI